MLTFGLRPVKTLGQFNVVRSGRHGAWERLRGDLRRQRQDLLIGRGFQPHWLLDAGGPSCSRFGTLTFAEGISTPSGQRPLVEVV